MEPTIHDSEHDLDSALGYVTVVERAIWGRAIARNIRNPNSRLNKSVAKSGLRGATLALVGNMWLAPALVCIVVSVILSLQNGSDEPAVTIQHVTDAVFAASVLLALIRLLTSVRATRSFKRVNAE